MIKSNLNELMPIYLQLFNAVLTALCLKHCAMACLGTILEIYTIASSILNIFCIKSSLQNVVDHYLLSLSF